MLGNSEVQVRSTSAGVYMCVWYAQLCLVLCDRMDYSPKGSSMGFSRQEYWSGLPFPLLGDLPNPGIELASLMSPAVVGRFFTTAALAASHLIVHP